jgi:lipid-A-disaccharide synthase
MNKRVFITVAEVSGDLHAAQLIRSLRRLSPELIIEGIGGPAMAAAGATLHRETVGGAAMTWRGALRAVEVWQLLRWTRRYFKTFKPDLQICVDSFAMNIHFAKLAHSMGLPVLMYVAPQLWAWREGRMKKLRRNVDRVACLLPFEEAYFRKHGVNATFVGHPLFDELPADRGAADANEPKGDRVVGLLPGSRKSEAMSNFPHMLDVAEQIRAAIPSVRFLVPTTEATHPVVERDLSAWRASASGRMLEFAQGAFDQMVPRCDLCITVSGTATLHVASFGVPMIVVYRASPIAWHALARWLMKTRTFALVNLLAGGKPPERTDDRSGHIVPEFVPWYGSNAPVANLAIQLLQHPERREAQKAKLRRLVKNLDRPGASDNVARIALEMTGEAVQGVSAPGTEEKNCISG